MQLHKVDDADEDRINERNSRASVVHDLFAVGRKAGFFEFFRDLFLTRRLECGAFVVLAQIAARHAEFAFHDLSDIHTGRNAERIQANVERCAVFEIRHIFDRKDARDDALVSVASGHLVAFAELTLVCDKHFDHFVDAGI